MNREPRAFGISIALHGTAIFLVVALGGGMERTRGSRIIDFSVLRPSGGEILSPPPRAAASREGLPTRGPSRIEHRLPTSPLPLDEGPGTPIAPLLPIAPIAPIAAVEPETRPLRVSDGEEEAPMPVPSAGPLPLVTAGGETSQSAYSATATADPSPAAAPGDARLVVATGSRGAASATRDGSSNGKYREEGGRVPWNLAFIREIVQRHLAYPSVAREMGWEGTVTLSFVISGNGWVRDVMILESSGRDVLDQYAKDRVQKISGFPPVASDARVIIPVVFRLN